MNKLIGMVCALSLVALLGCILFVLSKQSKIKEPTQKEERTPQVIEKVPEEEKKEVSKTEGQKFFQKIDYSELEKSNTIEVTIPSLGEGEIELINKESSNFLIDFKISTSSLSEYQWDIVATIKDKGKGKIIQEIKEEACGKVGENVTLVFFDLDKNSFIDFVIKDCFIGANNISDALFLSNPSEYKFIEQNDERREI